MKILITGGRNFKDSVYFAKVLLAIHTKHTIIEIIHGDARGADNFASRWAQAYNIKETAYKADWEKYGKAAGPIRNKKMLFESKPDFILAFPGGRGTANMIYLGEENKYKVIKAWGA